MALEEPSISEMIRDIDDRTRRMEASQSTYVTRELYGANREADLKRVADLEARAARTWALVAAPVIVGVILWFLTTGLAK